MDAPTGFVMSHTGECQSFQQKGTSMTEITTIGLDLAKSVFQIHCADKEGRPVLRKKLTRSQLARFFAQLGVPVTVHQT